MCLPLRLSLKYGIITHVIPLVDKFVRLLGCSALAAVLLLPFLRAGLQYLLFKGAAGITAGLADKRLHKLLERLGEAMAMLLACIGSCGLMLFLSIYSLMKVTLG